MGKNDTADAEFRNTLSQELQLTEEQKRKFMALLPQINELNKRLSVINWCISALSINVPVPDCGDL